MEHLTELKGVLFAGELEIPADENKHSTVNARWLTINGCDGVMTLLKRERSEFGNDILRALNLLTFEGEHGSFLVERGETGTVSVEGGVVMLDECLGQRIWIHRFRFNRRR